MDEALLTLTKPGIPQDLLHLLLQSQLIEHQYPGQQRICSNQSRVQVKMCVRASQHRRKTICTKSLILSFSIVSGPVIWHYQKYQTYLQRKLSKPRSNVHNKKTIRNRGSKKTEGEDRQQLTLHPREKLQGPMCHTHNRSLPLPCWSHPQMNSLPKWFPQEN